ncbi:hypothetical protein YC2023_028551 [Brassica napus]
MSYSVYGLYGMVKQHKYLTEFTLTNNKDILFSIAPTNGDPNCDVKRIKPPTGIPKFMLVASGAVAVLKPNEDAFKRQMERLPSTTCSVGKLPHELKCPL